MEQDTIKTKEARAWNKTHLKEGNNCVEHSTV